jgi:hypothetical protein
LLDAVPQSKKLALLVNPTTGTTTPSELREVPLAAEARGLQVSVMTATAESDFASDAHPLPTELRGFIDRLGHVIAARHIDLSHSHAKCPCERGSTPPRDDRPER